MTMVWMKFFFSALVIIAAGVRITGYARIIAEKTGLGVIWGGFVLLPMATSLPELVTSWRSAVIDAPDLAAGNLLGSIIFNLSIIALIDLAQGKGGLFYRLSYNHILSASFGLIIAGFTVFAMLVPFNLRVLWVGLDTLIIVILYGVAVFLVSTKEKNENREEEDVEPKGEKEKSLIKAVAAFVALAAVIVLAGITLTDAADSISVSTGLGQTFVGTLLLAASTSLPELVTTFTAARMGLLNMAVANIYGANLMNFALLFCADLFYLKGPLFTYISRAHLITLSFVIIITAISIFALIYRSKKHFANMGYDSLIIFTCYILAFVFLYYANVSP